jgi:eukaryotic-like serine/threonine-protein kinase
MDTDTTTIDSDQGSVRACIVHMDTEHDGPLLPDLADQIGPALMRAQVETRLFGSALKIDRFEIERRIGRGGMGEVYLANDPQLRRRVAIKLLHHGLTSEVEAPARERVHREAQALARISHPNVIEVYEVGDYQGRPFVAMEYVEGSTLQSWLDEHDPTWQEIVTVFVAAGRGLLAAHRAGLVHRDFKPENVLISGVGAEQRVRVLDFGLARLAAVTTSTLETMLGNDDDQLTRVGAVIGTPAYMSPEQLRGDTADEASDQFSFCLALYRALWKRDAFGGRGVTERLERMQLHEPTPPHQRNRRRLWPIVRQGLALQPEQRWPNMETLLDTLEQTTRRRWPLAALAGVLVLGIGLGLGLNLVGEPPATEPETVDPCRHVASQAATLWTPARAKLTQARFEAIGTSAARQAFVELDASLSRWSSIWGERRLQLCRDGEDDSRQAVCLDRVHADTRPLVDAFVVADTQTVGHALRSIGELPSLQACEDAEVLEHALAPVADGREQELANHREALAQARTWRLTGHYEAADKALDALADAAADFDYPVFGVELAIERGRLGLELEQPDKSLPILVDAAKLAERNRHDRLAAEAWTICAHWAANAPTGPTADTRAWLERAEISVDRLGSPDDLEARLDCIRGSFLASKRAHRDEARVAFERALARLDRLADDQSLLGTRTWRPVCLANFAEISEGPRGVALAEQALASAEQLYGEAHPTTARFAFTLAQLLLTSDEPHVRARSAELLERAAAGAITGKPSALDVAEAQTNLAAAAHQAGRSADARRHLVVATEIYARELPPTAYQHAGPLLIAGAMAFDEGDMALALDKFDRARAYLVEPGLEPQLRQVDRNRAMCLLDLGRVDAARDVLTAQPRARGGDESIELLLTAIALHDDDLERARPLLDALQRPLPPLSTLAREALAALVDLRTHAGVECQARAAALLTEAAAVDATELRGFERLIQTAKITEDERRCLGVSQIMTRATAD